MERHLDHRSAHWFASLFAVHDVDALTRLDTPWWSYGAIDVVAAWLDRRVETRVFEYGAGASTVWLARRATHVDSVEHDPAFAAVVAGIVPDNTEIHVVEPTFPDGLVRARSRRRGSRHLDFGDYVETIRDAPGPFDLVAIDGRARVACLEEALRHLRPGGLIVLDNAGRREYRHALRRLPVTAAFHRGPTPSLPYLNTTAIVEALP